MQKALRALLISLPFLVACCSHDEPRKVNEEFFMDLASEDNRIAATLYGDVFDGSLDSLSYDAYIRYFSGHELPAAKGAAGLVKKADEHYFATKKEAFLLVLYYKSEGKIIGDNSETAQIDTVITLVSGEKVPGLEEIGKKLGW